MNPVLWTASLLSHWRTWQLHAGCSIPQLVKWKFDSKETIGFMNVPLTCLQHLGQRLAFLQRKWYHLRLELPIYCYTCFVSSAWLQLTCPGGISLFLSQKGRMRLNKTPLPSPYSSAQKGNWGQLRKTNISQSSFSEKHFENNSPKLCL